MSLIVLLNRGLHVWTVLQRTQRHVRRLLERSVPRVRQLLRRPQHEHLRGGRNSWEMHDRAKRRVTRAVVGVRVIRRAQQQARPSEIHR